MEENNLDGKYSELHRSYSLISSKDDSRAEQQRVRFNQILQGRKEISRSLTGSQITYVLDYFISQIFSIISQCSEESPKVHEVTLSILRREHRQSLHRFFKSKKRLISIRYTNQAILCNLLHLNFVNGVREFSNLFINLRLNRSSYYAAINVLLSAYKELDDPIAVGLRGTVELLYSELKNFKSLLAGNYVRYAYSDASKFYDEMQSKRMLNCSLTEKEDYFSGLIVRTLNAIDRYDSFKGTLKTFIANWFKEYRITYINNLSQAASYELSAGAEAYLQAEDYQALDSSDGEEGVALVWSYIQRAIDGGETPSRLVKDLIISNREIFPAINNLIDYFEGKASQEEQTS